MDAVSVRNLPLHRPVILTIVSTVKEAALAMETNNIGSVLVNDEDGKLVGIITDRDLALALAIQKIKVTDRLQRLLFDKKLVFVTAETTLKDVVDLMREERMRRVPVVHESNGQQTCIGIITLDDLIKAKLLEDEGEKSFIKRVAEATQLSQADARNLILYLMTTILRRIPSAEGKNLLSKFPYVLQMELIPELDSDEIVESSEIVAEIANRFKKTPEESIQLLRETWQAIGNIIAPGETNKVSLHLPKDMRQVFLETDIL